MKTVAPVVLIGGPSATQRLRVALARIETPDGCLLEVDLAASGSADALRTIAAARIAVLCAGSWPDDRDNILSACLLCLNLTGTLPIICLSQPDSSDFPDFRRAMEKHSAELHVASPSILADPAGLPAAVADKLRRGAKARDDGSFRMRPDAGQSGRSISGLVVSGRARVGSGVILLPPAAHATVTAVEEGPDGRQTLRLDQPLKVQAGGVLAASDARPDLADQVAAHLVWLGDEPMLPGRSYRIRIGNQTASAQISSLRHKVEPVDLGHIAARRLELGETALCNLSFSSELVFDPEVAGSEFLPETGRFVLEDPQSGATVGIGRIAFTLRRATNIHWQALAVDKSTRATLKGQRPCCLWFTGLSGSGKSTVASLLEKRLIALGRHTYMLDGDNVRHGLNRDLGFTDADRVENIRRVAEVSKLFVDAGLIVMVSFISPFRAERRMAREFFPPDEFLEVYVDTPLEICERRDVKGLYKKARAGQLKNFTGIDSPYEPPENPEVRLDGGSASPEELVERMLQELTRRRML